MSPRREDEQRVSDALTQGVSFLGGTLVLSLNISRTLLADTQSSPQGLLSICLSSPAAGWPSPTSEHLGLNLLTLSQEEKVCYTNPAARRYRPQQQQQQKKQSALIRKKYWWLEGFLLSPLPGADVCLEDPVISINIANN